ncbi:hypothetical protein HYX12_04545, partial [Candidatus Woesearchaeota archaeon]|nr:hypothetical protein [Candidatus Woesearchaeota archaeon]
MVGLLRRRTDPEQARVDISSIVERIEVTAFPMLRDCLVDKEEDFGLEGVASEHRPKALWDMRRASGNPVREEELFTPVYALQEFHVDIGCSAFYLAEGFLALPALSDRVYGMKFGLPTHHPKDHWWFLRLSDGTNRYHGYSGEQVVQE